MSIKTIIYLAVLIIHGSITSMDDSKGVMSEYGGYSQEDLIAARIIWAGQENRIEQLFFEAWEYAAQNPLNYFSGHRYVAQINAKTETVTTWLPCEKSENNKSVTLHYSDFKKFINDKKIMELAAKYQREKNKVQ